MLRFLGGETRGDAWLALGGGATARSYGVCLRGDGPQAVPPELTPGERSEEHTSELQSLMRISYAVFCLKKKNIHTTPYAKNTTHRHTITLHRHTHMPPTKPP